LIPRLPLPSGVPQPQPDRSLPPAIPANPIEPVEPRTARIRADLEQAGMSVHEVVFQPADNRTPPMWAAIAEASYGQPSREAVLRQAFTTWEVMYGVLRGENPQTSMRAGQVWTKFLLLLSVPLGEFAILTEKAADPSSEGALEAFLQGIHFVVFDLETDQPADEQDFINKNFTGG
jgi:hypothetical protein